MPPTGSMAVVSFLLMSRFRLVCLLSHPVSAHLALLPSPLCPVMSSPRNHHYHSPLTAGDESESILVFAAFSPFPWGLCGSLTLLKVWWLRHPAGVSAAALPSRLGLAGYLSARPAPVPLLSLLPSWNLSQCTTAWALWRQGQALRVARKPPRASLDTRPPVVEALRKKEAKKKPQRASRGSGRAIP